ncbi:MAG TPA: response regulator [Candidatus Acidoferrales bacterium]|nr:response regulator [Candidatus Acidoferrales bacterium]
MSTILVADDNSNIQKMVGLALKDQGIEVVAVGNGEAAVRRISDVHPDLVLADVFMPVKNGYEVCEFVKKDQRFSHIPVILLVGAFDPLDEHEAQRVGADGVLKKPFVPPDPLISMVKSALSRSAGESGRPRPIPMPKRSGAAPAAAIPDVEAKPAAVAAPPFAIAGLKAGASEPEPLSDELGIPPRTEAVTFSEGEKPLAFGSLLETGTKKEAPAEPEASAEQEYVAPVQHNALTEARKWGSAPAEEEAEEEEEPKAAWRRDAPDDEESVAAAESLGAVKDWRDFDEPAGSTPAHTEPAPAEKEPQPETTDFFAPEATPENEVIREDPSAHGNSHATEAESFFASHAEHAEAQEISEAQSAKEETGTPDATKDREKAYETVFTPESYPGLFVEEKAPTKLSLQDDSADSTSAFAEIATAEDEQATAPEKVKEEERRPVSSGEEFPVPNLWEEQVRLAARTVAASWPSEDSEVRPPAASAESIQTRTETVGNEAPATSEEDWHSPVIPEEETSEDEHVAEVHTPPEAWPEPPAREAASAPAMQTPQPEAVAVPTPPAASDIEAVVAKVLERLDPKMFQSVTQQLLKPVIEAIVRSELEKKK